MAPQRLDQLLTERGLAPSRQQAQRWIQAGLVRSGCRILDKPGHVVPDDISLELQAPARFVSRGGEKLAGALGVFPIAVQGRICLDGGISTGGFSDCLLQRGAARIYGVDVGYGQLAWKLRSDPRVMLRERTNLRHLAAKDLYGEAAERADLAVADVSFISLTLVLPALRRLVMEQAEAVLLIKPQFEVGRERVGRGGVVRDAAAHRQAIARVIGAAAEHGWGGTGLVGSPLTGPAGNHEYLLWLRPQPQTGLADDQVAEEVARTLAGGRALPADRSSSTGGKTGVAVREQWRRGRPCGSAPRTPPAK